MTTNSDQLLCDYIFGLLEDSQKSAVEEQLKDSAELSGRFKELNEIFCGLDKVKEEYPSPVSRIMAKLYRFSCAGAAMASALTIFWATAFGSVNSDFMESGYSSTGDHLKKSAISCTSGAIPSEKATYQFTELANYRE